LTSDITSSRTSQPTCIKLSQTLIQLCGWSYSRAGCINFYKNLRGKIFSSRIIEKCMRWLCSHPKKKEWVNWGSFLLLNYWKKEKYADFVTTNGRGTDWRKKMFILKEKLCCSGCRLHWSETGVRYKWIRIFLVLFSSKKRNWTELIILEIY